jgi:hypothetical protein
VHILTPPPYAQGLVAVRGPNHELCSYTDDVTRRP